MSRSLLNLPPKGSWLGEGEKKAMDRDGEKGGRGYKSEIAA